MKLGYKILIVVLVVLALATTFLINGKDEITVTAPSNSEETEIAENQVVNNEKDDVLDIYVATDIHYLSNRVNDKGEAFQKMVESGDGRQLNYSTEIVDAFTYNIIEKKPEVLIISGDLTHNGEKASHEDMAKRLQEIEDMGTEVFVIPGNHDVNNPWARAFVGENQELTENVTPEEFETIYKNFGYSDYISRDEESLSYLAEANEEVWVLMLDSSLYENNTSHPVTNGRLDESTLDWVKECSELAKENNVQLVTAMHHNLYNHSDLLNRGFTIDNSEEVYNTFLEAGINFVLSGHIHIQDIKVDKENKVYDIATSVLIGYPQQYGKISFDSEKGFSYTTEIIDVEQWAKDTGIDDENLLNFSVYSREYREEEG